MIGFPLQQMLVASFPTMGAYTNWFVAVPLAISFGAASWFLSKHPGKASDVGNRGNDQAVVGVQR
ncbi:hypothetical protein AWB68_07982 [Caballeronia choica]|uniref:Uncharacterized protein n=1 Tax=Caballeronia choica TaxID=326476 RepID=A0A158KZX4_9BURK|nr:hypothetical protein AWB68_07982 [Caballeronia choica]